MSKEEAKKNITDKDKINTILSISVHIISVEENVSIDSSCNKCLDPNCGGFSFCR